MKNDRENFLAALLLPAGAREATIAVRAFNVSVALVRDQVSQNTIGEMRMHFWNDAIDAVYDDRPQQQPVVLQLHKAVRGYRLSKRWLKRIVSSRQEALSDRSFATVAAAETYAENSVSSVLYLTLETLDLRDVHADHAASHIGKALGLVTLLRSVPHNALRQRVQVPVELLVRHRVSQQELLRGSAEKHVKDLVFDVAGSANAHLEKARSLSKQVPSKAKMALLPAVTASTYLDRLRKADFNVFDGELQQRNQLLPLTLLWNKIRKKY